MGSGGGWFIWIEGEDNLLPRAIPCHDHWHELQRGGQAQAIVVNFGEGETGFVLGAGGSIASQS